MRFTTVHDYPAGLDRLSAAFGRPEYAQQQYRALGATDVRVRRFDVGAQSIDVDLERDVPVDASQLPGWVRAFVGTGQTLRQRTTWRWVRGQRPVAGRIASGR